MKKALIISKTKQSVLPLAELLNSEGYDNIASAHTYEEAKLAITTHIFDLIVVNSVLADQSGVNVATFAAQKTRACVIVIMPAEQAQKISDQMAQCGVLVISKPINKHLFHHYLMFTDYFKRRMFCVVEENDKLKQMVEEMKLISRAKCLLMQCLSMSEPQAHRYLEKQAMDMRLSKLEIAKQVLKTYDN